MTKSSPIWHPMTQHKIFREQIFVQSAAGAYLTRKDGTQILDAISSWWVITHGHCHPKIVEAVRKQAGKLEQVIFAGFTHEPAEKLAEKLLELTAPNLKHVFFSDSGSTSVEVALKMAIGYHAHSGRPRTKILALEGGYHGDTFGAMAAGSRSIFNKVYSDYLFDVEFIPRPGAVTFDGKSNCPQKRLKDILDREGENVAAFIFEPLVQGAAGMQVYDAPALKELHDMCRAKGVLTIADEVMTGFGRTGTFFACEQAGITPDLVCLSKGLTGGFLPMGLTLATREIYNAFYDEDRRKTFFHSTSFSGNPLACAAALANLEIWEEEPVFERIAAISEAQEDAAANFATHPQIAQVRTKGTILALDVLPSPSIPLPEGRGKAGAEREQGEGYLSFLGPVLYNYFLEHNILLRPIGNCLYVLPPYCVNRDELERIYEGIYGALSFLRNAPPQSPLKAA